VTVIVSSSLEAGAVSAANTRNDAIIVAMPAQARQFFGIPIVILPEIPVLTHGVRPQLL
jgi:hypothetical protein